MDNCEEASCVTARDGPVQCKLCRGGSRTKCLLNGEDLPHLMVFAVGCGARSAKEGHLVDALALRGDEGRGTLRKAAGRGEHPLIRGSPNGETRPYWVIAC